MTQIMFILNSSIISHSIRLQIRNTDWDRGGCDRMVVGFATT